MVGTGVSASRGKGEAGRGRFPGGKQAVPVWQQACLILFTGMGMKELFAIPPGRKSIRTERIALLLALTALLFLMIAWQFGEGVEAMRAGTGQVNQSFPLNPFNLPTIRNFPPVTEPPLGSWNPEPPLNATVPPIT